MNLEPDAIRAIDEIARRALGAFARGDAKEELRSHLFAAAARHAQEAGRPTVTRADVLRAAQGEGGEEGLARAFGRGSPTQRRAKMTLVALVGTRVVAALVGVLACIVALRNTGVGSVSSIVAILGIASLLLALAGVLHALRRQDLDQRGRIAWVLALLFLEPLAGIVYFSLGRRRSRDLVRSIAGADEGPA